MLNSIVAKWTLDQNLTILYQFLNESLTVLQMINELGDDLFKNTQPLGIVCKIYEVIDDSVSNVM